MSLFTRAKNGIPLSQHHRSLRFMGRPDSTIRSFHSGLGARFTVPLFKSKMANSSFFARTYPKEFTTSTRNVSKDEKTHPELPTQPQPEEDEEGQRATEAKTIASLNSPTSHNRQTPPMIAIHKIPGKGNGIIATRHIPAGTILHAEKPLLQSSTASKLSIELSFLLLTPRTLPYLSLLSATHAATPSDSRSIRIWNTNHFAVSPPHLRVGCLYIQASFLNHSCKPNAEYCFTETPEGKCIIVIAKKDILEGEEVTQCYVGPDIQLLPAAERKSKIRERCNFECQCPACKDGNSVIEIPNPTSPPNQRPPFPKHQLANIDILDLADAESRRGARAAQQLVDRWTTDFKQRITYWQTIITVLVTTHGPSHPFTDPVLNWITHHTVRSHTTWLQDHLIIDTGTRRVHIPDDILMPYLERMMLRAAFSLREGGNGLGLRGVVERVRVFGGRRHEFWFECGEVVRGVVHVGVREGEGEGEELELERALVDDAIEKHRKAGFGKGFFKQ